MLGTAAPERLVYHAIPHCSRKHKDGSDKKLKSPNDFVNRVYPEIDLSSQYNCSSSSEFEFLYSTDPSEEGLSEREIRKRTDHDLLARLPGPESQLEEVQTSRDRPKSAPYPRLKNSKKTSKCQVFFYSSRKSNIFRNFFLKKLHTKKWTEWRANVSQCRKTERGDPLRFFNTHSVAKHQKNAGGTL